MRTGTEPVRARAVFTFLLSLLILTCPMLCGEVEADHAARADHPVSTPADHPASNHCDHETDDCICRGAVQSADVRLPGLDSISIPLEVHGLNGLLAHSPAHPLTHLTRDGAPTGLAGWGGSAVIRALLQIFRC